MLRWLYVASMLWLQAAIVVEVAPTWGQALARELVTVSVHDGWAAVVPLAGAAVALAAGAIALGAPAIALLRHHQRGPRRFDGVPRWAAVVAVAGAAVHVAACVPWWLVRRLPVEARVEMLVASEPCAAAGLALMAAGALCAELLRRGARPAHAISVSTRAGSTAGARPSAGIATGPAG